MGVQYAPGFLSRGASSPPVGFRSSERGGSASGLLSVAHEHALASLTPSGAGEGWVARSQRSFFYAHYTPRLTFTIPRRTFDDVGNCGNLRRIATAFYPLVVSDLRIVVLVWIRELFTSGGGLRTATALDVCAVDCGETGIDSRSCRVRSRCVWSRSFDCYQSHRLACVFPARRGDLSDR